MELTKDTALQFVIMVQAGLPASSAITYFTDSSDQAELHAMLSRWLRSKQVQEAQRTLMGKAWQDMSLREKVDYALESHYAQLAFMLFNNHFSEVGPADLAKMNTARVALEAFKAGTSGKTDALSAFFDDLRTGKVKLSKPAPLLVQ